MRERITSRKNETLKHIKRLGRDRDYRYLCREFVLDGEKLLYEAIENGATIRTVLYAEDKAESLPDIAGARTYVVPRDVLDDISSLSSAQSVVFTCAMPEAARKLSGRAILLDRLQDTGNVGTIIRTADAFGIDMIIEDGCADIYNPKTIRSAMGSLFRVPIVSCPMEDAIAALKGDGVSVYAATLARDARTIAETDVSSAAIVIGNEGNGVREDVISLCDGCVIIPMQGGAESLNAAVAAAIFMYKMSGGQDS